MTEPGFGCEGEFQGDQEGLAAVTDDIEGEADGDCTKKGSYKYGFYHWGRFYRMRGLGAVSGRQNEAWQ